MESVFNFNDYRAFLKAYFHALPKRGHGEARKLAIFLGVSSTFVSQVFSSTRFLTSEQANRVAEYLGLNKLEKDYFYYLVQFERAGTADLRKYLSERIEELKRQSLSLVSRVEARDVLSEEVKAIFYSSPLYSAIHLYSSTSEEGRGLDEISERFELPRPKAIQIVRFLHENGFLLERANKYQMLVRHTHLDQNSPHLLKHYAHWRLKAIQASEALSENELMYSAQVSLSQKDFESLREQMAKFIEKFVKSVADSPAEEIAAFNLDWFRIRK